MSKKTQSEGYLQWRPIPRLSSYELRIDKDGEPVVRNKITRRIVKFFEVPTTVGTYICCWVIQSDGQRRSHGVHVLVCLAFHGEPPSERHTDVNHKDGDKHNNHPDNLEWMTRSENITHSYRERHRTDSRRVIAHDHKTGRKTEYHSMAALARDFELRHLKGSELLRLYHTDKYQDRWTFSTVENCDYVAPRRKLARHVYAYDYKNRKLYCFDNIQQLTMTLGFKPTTVSKLVREKKPRLFNGFVFRRAGESRQFPQFTPEEAETSIVEYQKRQRQYPSKTKVWGVTVKDHRTGKVVDYATVKAAAKAIDWSVGRIVGRLNEKSLEPHGGYSFRHPDDSREFPELTEEELRLHLQTKRKDEKPIVVTDTFSNTTENYGSIRVFAKAIGEDPLRVRRRVERTGRFKHYRVKAFAS